MSAPAETARKVVVPFDEAPAIVHDARTQWLMRRRELVTASDVAKILGLHPKDRPSDVYLEKIGDGADEADGWPLFYGNAFQDGVGRAYAHHTGRKVEMIPLERPELVEHPDIPWLAASPDGRVLEGSEVSPAPAEGQGALEVKVSSVGHTWSEDELPVQFQLQNTVQQACMGLKWGAIAAFVSLRQAPRVQDLIFDQDLFDLMVPKLEAFHRCVKTKTPPMDDASWWSADAVKALWSVSSGEAVKLDDQALSVVQDWRTAKDAQKKAEAAADELGKLLRLRLAGAAIGNLPDGSAVVLSNVKAGWVAAFQRAAHTRLLFKEAKGRK